MGTLLKPGEAPIPFDPPEGRTMFTIEQLHAAVGGYIEVVRAPFTIMDTGEPMYIVLNEDGRRDHLAPVNRFATALYHQAGGPVSDIIVGTAVLASRRELNGDDDDPEGP